MLAPIRSRILATKLYPPTVSVHAMLRPRLLAQLASLPGRRVTVITAPAGFGKTTLISQWLATSAHPAAWLSLDAADNDLATFLAYVAAAIQTVLPHTCEETLRLTQSPQLPPVPYIVNTLLNDIVAAGESFFLVLNDYHHIRSAGIHELMTRLIQYMPPNLHLVLASRTEPPLGLARQHAQANLVYLTAEELRFTPAEAGEFLAAKCWIDPPARAAVADKTEGWPLALHLVLLSLQETADSHSIVEALERGSHRPLVGYLTDEVIAAQPRGIQDFLRVTSLFDRFSARLVEAVWEPRTQDHDAESALAAVRQANLFLTTLDEVGNWHRYHSLFRAVLQVQLQTSAQPGEIQGLHRRASTWFAGQGLPEEGLYHALAGEDMAAAAALVERSVQPLLNQEDWPRLENLLQQLPETVMAERPALLLARAWVYFLCGKFAALPQLLDEAHKSVAQMEAPGANKLLGEKEALLGQLESIEASLLAASGIQNSLEAFALAGSALKRLPPAYGLPRRQAIAYRAVTGQRIGRGAEAREMLEAALTRSAGVVSTFTEGALLAMAHLALVNCDMGQYDLLTRQLVQTANRIDLPISRTWGDYARAMAAYAQGRFDEAQPILARVMLAPYQAQLGAVRAMGCMLVLLHQLRGEWAVAEDVLDTTRTLVALVARFGAQQRLVDSFTARSNIVRGELEAALQWADHVSPDTLPDFPDDFEQPRLTYAIVRVAQGTPRSLAEAILLLRRLNQEAETIHYLWRKVRILPVLALAYAAVGNERAALATLEESLKLAAPAGLMTAFVEHGQPMYDLLRRLDQAGGGSSFLASVLASWEQREHAPQPAAPPAGKPAPATPVTSDVLPLDVTRRELEVLRLMGRGWSNKEIAQALVVSPATVARHSANIYAKLGVSRRRQAVRRAGELGLLIPA